MGLALTLALAGCSGSGSGEGADDGRDGASPGRRTGEWPQARFASALEPYDSCGALLDDVQARALERVGPYGFDTMPGYVTDFETTGAAIAEDGGVDAPTAAPGGAANRTSSSEALPDGSSDTNTQVAGVDEPDVVKTDGTTLYSTVDGHLLVVDAGGEAPTPVGRLDLPSDGTSPELLVHGERALVIDSTWGAVGRPLPVEPVGGPGGTGTGGNVAAFDPGTPSTELTLVDLSDRTAPRVVERLSVDGTLLGARMVDGRARLVTSTTGTPLDFVYPTGSGGEDAAEATNRRIIEESTIEDWLPQARLLGPSGDLRRVDPVVDCEDVAHPGVDAGDGMVSVLSLDVDGGSLVDAEAVSVQAAGETIYASSDTLYVATYEMPSADVRDDPQQAVDEDFVTAVHAFDISGDDPAAYLATGEVRGSLLNQFSMDEHDGVLRVATTAGSPWGRMAAPSTESFVTTLEQRDGELVELGRVGDMGHGERIHSVRFLGDVGYVVTFRQVDPLYTIDLSDPASPTVTGELKIPGFSSYLHPTEPGKLIGIGQDATDEGRTTGTQVSVFDVSDPAEPLRTAQWTLPGGHSMAEGDHHAFLWWAADDLLVIPASSMQVVPTTEDQRGVPTRFEGVIGLDVSDTAITERGRITHEHRPLAPVACPEGTPCEPDRPDTPTGPTGPTGPAGPRDPSGPTLGCEESDCGVGGTSQPAPPPPGQQPDRGARLLGSVPIERSLVVDGRLVTVSPIGITISRLADLVELGHLATTP